MAKGLPNCKRVKFGEVVRLVKETCKDPVAAGIERVIGLEHLEPGDLRVRFWNEVADGTTFTTRVRPGQVLFGKRRAYQRKVAVADFDAVCSGDIYVLESANPERLLPELLPFICQTESFFEHAVGTSAGSLSPRTNWSRLAEYEFPLPSIEHQQRAIRHLAASNKCLDALRSAEDAADRLLNALSHGLLFPSRRPGISGEHDGVPWRVVPIEGLCSRATDLAIGPNGENLVRADYAGRDRGVPVIFVRDIRPNRFEYRSQAYVSEEKARRLALHHACPGDLVVTKVGVPEALGIPPGLAAVVPPAQPWSLITADVLRVRLDPNKAIPEFICYVLNSPWGRAQTWRLSPGSTTRFKMRLADFAQIRIAVPPVNRQLASVKSLQHVEQSAEAIRARRAATAQTYKRAIAALLEERVDK